MLEIYHPTLSCGEADYARPEMMYFWRARVRPEACGQRIKEGDSFVKINRVYYCDNCTRNLTEIAKRLLPD